MADEHLLTAVVAYLNDRARRREQARENGKRRRRR
jgi:hypothetical protein